MFIIRDYTSLLTINLYKDKNLSIENTIKRGRLFFKPSQNCYLLQMEYIISCNFPYFGIFPLYSCIYIYKKGPEHCNGSIKRWINNWILSHLLCEWCEAISCFSSGIILSSTCEICRDARLSSWEYTPWARASLIVI